MYVFYILIINYLFIIDLKNIYNYEYKTQPVLA